MDRISSLSDDLIIKILSYNQTKQAIRTCILSSRWKNIWRSIPILKLTSDDLTSLTKFHQFTRLFSSRNTDIELSSIKLTVGGFNQTLIRRVISYALSYNHQKMTIFWSVEMRTEIPNSLFMSQSLEDLTLIGPARYYAQPEINSILDLPSLTTLHLENVILNHGNPGEYGGIFSKCLNLKNLTLSNCSINDHTPSISHPELSKLTPEKGLYSYANVVVPHLKNLNALDCNGRIKIYAPRLSTILH
ncbi:putative F-box/FBD/LRR-repeat protein At3g56780 [Rutidosis leptorrhynchoides]|uniref:putative F-box/FBD/LRR-repeat protein At3g56780 n=1 Tax=Rutidosis leptorrhynchoides TaxID=125765 RepID=UPI003A9A432D